MWPRFTWCTEPLPGPMSLESIARFTGSLLGLASNLSEFQKQLIDRLAQDMANYTDEFARQFAQGINADLGSSPLQVKRFSWSSENHHTGRAIAALQLLVELCQSAPPPDRPSRFMGTQPCRKRVCDSVELAG